MTETGILDILSNHKEELACVGAASICYNLIQYLRRSNSPKVQKATDKKQAFSGLSIRFDTSTRQISNPLIKSVYDKKYMIPKDVINSDHPLLD